MSMTHPDVGAGPSASRRAFLQAGVATAGVLLVGFRVPTRASERKSGEGFAPNAFVRIDRQGTVTLIMPQVEMGQGVYTSIAMIVAEELDANWEQVGVQHAPPSDALYKNPTFGLQVTGNSNSIRAFWMPLRKAGASARTMLVQAAALRWGVQPDACRADSGTVVNASDGRKLAYGALVDAASRLTPPADPVLKSPADFRLIGRSLMRLDTPEKVNGKAIYGIDVMPPGVRFATLAASPVLGGKVRQVEDGKAKAVPGVRQIVVLEDLVAVVGDNMWAARQGLAALAITWDDGPNAEVTTDMVWSQLRAASEKAGVVARSVGDAGRTVDQPGAIEATYEMPFLAHAAMEPLNCTVHVRPDSCEVWTGTQVLARAQAVAAKVTGLPLEKVTARNHFLGGGFGRRLEVDMVESAVRIGQKVDGPVKVVWTREEDIRHDLYRPVYLDRLKATLDEGRIASWSHRITGSAVMARWLPPAFKDGIDIDAIDGAADMPYAIPNLRVEYVRDEPPGVTTGFWRGVGPNNNVFAIESFVDELAARVGQDPVAFRRQMLDKTPRLRAALEMAARKAGWGSALPARTGRGVAVQVAFESFIATVAEAEVDTNGEVHLRRVVSAVDTGIAVNPDTVVAQLEGGLIFGLTAALHGEITLDRGRVQQSNFHDYRMLRMNEVPKIEVHVIRSGEPPGGIGETGTVAAPPALCNAIFAATGIRLRRLPIDRDQLAARGST